MDKAEISIESKALKEACKQTPLQILIHDTYIIVVAGEFFAKYDRGVH